MAIVYAGAQCVLLLDSELMRWDSKDHVADHQSEAILAARLIDSGWMTRAWTLHEGVLARSIYVATVGGLMKLFGSQPSSVSGSEHVFEGVISTTLGDRPVQLPSEDFLPSFLTLETVRHMNDFMRLLVRPLQLQTKKPERPHSDELKVCESDLRLQQFVEAWNALIGRQTTQAEDRHAILANLLDISAPIVMKEAERDRLPKMINTCPQLPLSILYNTGPRVGSGSSSEDSWIPLEVSDDPMAGGSYLQRVSEGFAVHFLSNKGVSPMAYILLDLGHPHGKFFRLCDRSRDEECFFVVERCDENVALQAEVGNSSENLGDHRAVQEVSEVDPLLPRGRRSRFILIMDPDVGSTSVHGYTGRGVQLIVGDDDTSDTYFTTYSTPVRFWSEQQFNRRFGHEPSRYGLFDAIDISQETRLIVKYGDLTRPSPANFTYFNVLANRPPYEKAPVATIPRRPILSHATWRGNFLWILSRFFGIFILYYVFLMTSDWAKKHCEENKTHTSCSRLKHTNPGAENGRSPLNVTIDLLVLPACAIMTLGFLTYLRATAINTYNRIKWLLTFEENWNYVPSFIHLWDIVLDAVVIVLMFIVLVFLIGFAAMSRNRS